MPELPEVESVRRGLSRARLRAPLVSVWRSDKPLRIGEAWRRERLDLLEGREPRAIRRRGKYLIWRFDDPGAARPPVGLLVHLGMTGRLLVHRPDEPLADHTHLLLGFADGRQVRFVDPRRFGGLRTDELVALRRSHPLCDLGPEPLAGELTGTVLQDRGGSSRRCIRDVLLDQSVVAGVGNIYALEALFAAGVHPLSPAHRLRASAWARIAEHLVAVLRQGVQNGGTTIRDFAGVSGGAGHNQHALRVYGRVGQPCVICRTAIVGFAFGGRGGALCVRCQPKGRGGWVR